MKIAVKPGRTQSLFRNAAKRLLPRCRGTGSASRSSGHAGQSHARLGPDLFRSCVEPQSWATIQALFHNMQFTEPDTNLLSLHTVPLVQRQLTLVPITASASETQSKSKNRAASSTSKDSTAQERCKQQEARLHRAQPGPVPGSRSTCWEPMGAPGQLPTGGDQRATVGPWHRASQAQLGAGCRGGRGFLRHASPATAAVAFVRLEDADKKGIEFECYANRNICVLKSVLSSWYI